MTMIAQAVRWISRVIVRRRVHPRPMEDLVERLARGNVTEVTVVLTTVVMALAVYQLVLIAVGYGKLRPRFLGAGPASKAHRASGDTIVVLILVVAAMCATYFGLEEDDAAFHAVTGAALVAVLALKIVVIRWWHAAGRFLPVLGITVFLLLAATWLSTAGSFLAET
jgi:Family of unknown function (DUF6529)